jgi:hypothetical protein
MGCIWAKNLGSKIPDAGVRKAQDPGSWICNTEVETVKERRYSAALKSQTLSNKE